MSDYNFSVQSYSGPYEVIFENDIIKSLKEDTASQSHFIVDEKVAKLYWNQLGPIFNNASVLYLEATEDNKSLDRFPAYVEHLVTEGIRRQHQLVAIGGGIIQDITCFLSATMLRGVNWKFYPTTLLAQTDSCIGSKSSINCRGVKNILGTFTPPRKITINPEFLRTLSNEDVRSGIGEILKVHAIDSPESFLELSRNYDQLFSDSNFLLKTIRRSLLIKKGLIEADEFDQGIRNLMNYGHSFGHAIESSTQYAVPHGIAVTIGMDVANYVAETLGLAPNDFYEKAHAVLKKNYSGYESLVIPMGDFFRALSKDKKNLSAQSLALILPNSLGKIEKTICQFDEKFIAICTNYFKNNFLINE